MPVMPFAGWCGTGLKIVVVESLSTVALLEIESE